MLYSGLYERVWHELPGGLQDFDALGDTLVEIASVESVYDIFTDWDDRRTGRRHVDMLWAGPPRPLCLNKASDITSDNLAVALDKSSMSCRSGSVVSQFDGEIEMVGFDESSTSMEVAADGSSSSDDNKKKSQMLTRSSEDDDDSRQGPNKGGKARVNLSIGSMMSF